MRYSTINPLRSNFRVITAIFSDVRIFSFIVSGDQSHVVTLVYHWLWIMIEQQHDKMNKMTCAPSADSDQPRQPPSLISLCCALNGKLRTWDFSSCRQRSIWSDWADAQADLCLCWAHRSFCLFCSVAAQLIWMKTKCVKLPLHQYNTVKILIIQNPLL